MNNFQVLDLKDLLEIHNGKDYKHLNAGDIPVYGSGGIMTYVDDYIYDGESILLPRKGTLDNIMYVNGKFWNVDTVYWTTIKSEKVYPKYLYCYLILLDLSSKNTGSTLPSMTFDVYYDIPIKLYDYDIQKRIGDFYFKIVEKIKNNQKIVSELESLTKTIYDYWFLQFEFPNEEGKPYKSSGGKMVWNETLKEEIPEIFEVKTVNDFCDIFTGKKDVNQAKDSGKYKFYSCAPTFRYSDDCLYSGKAILISGNGSYTGRTILVNDSFDLYQRTYACTTSYNFIEYIYCSLITYFVPRVSGGTHGSAIPYIVLDDISKENILYNAQIIEKFQKIILPIQDKIHCLKSENHELESLRDFLLPLLMNGQVTFKEGEENA